MNIFLQPSEQIIDDNSTIFMPYIHFVRVSRWVVLVISSSTTVVGIKQS